ncbi:MAG: lipid II flippase MurJ [Pseudobdellovibrionaceae bacterium]
MLKKFNLFRGKSWLYSLISLLNVGCGLSVTALVWYKYSATKESDILLLATSSISILAQLSLVGVEQVLYFYADERKKHQKDADHFFKLAFTWSMLSGAIFALVFLSLSKYFLMMVASGFSEEARSLAGYLLFCLSPQLVMSPSLHVLRAKWALDEKYGRAYLLSAVSSFILLICLIATMVFGITNLEAFGNISFSIFLAFLVAFVIYNRKFFIRPYRADWLRIKELIIHSSAVKGANAIHNFLIQALISSLLSKMPTGSISIFQYAKRLADGVFAITAGPQVMIYHSRCAKAISQWNKSEMRSNVIHFLKTFLSLFFAMAFVVYILTPFALSIVAKSFSISTIDEIRFVYLGVVLWYLIMGIETLSVGIILATRSSLILFGVNFTFIFLFFLWSRIHSIGSVLAVVFTIAGFQLVSFSLFTLSALWIIKRRSLSAR